MQRRPGPADRRGTARRPVSVAGTLAGCLLLAACGGTHESVGPTVGEATSPASSQVDGVWRTDGYGWVVQVADGHLKTYDVTSLSCIPNGDLTRIDGSLGGAAQFGKRDSPEETIARNPDGRSAELRMLGTAADIDLTPLPALPDLCNRPTASDPVTTFDVFWATFAENYNSTVRKHIDWNALRNQYRPMINASTTPAQLYQIMVDMITPLGDNHASIDAGKKQQFTGQRAGTRDDDQVDDTDVTGPIDEHLRQDLGVRDIKKWADGDLAYADLPGDRGYLRITAFQDWSTKPDDYVARQALLDKVLDEVFSDAHVRSWKGLVIDLSYNEGGDDQLGLSIAGRLTDTPYTAYTKYVRNNPTDPTKYGRAHVVTVQPTAGRPHYTGPLRLLTSDLTVSAGETFSEAVMARTPAATRVGTTTQGVFADDMDRKLPNGWSFTVGSEDYIAPDGRNYEGPGIPPTTQVPNLTPQQLAAHQYPALDLPGDTR